MCQLCAFKIYSGMMIYGCIAIIGIVVCVKINVFSGLVLICAPILIRKIKSIMWNINYERNLRKEL